MTKQRPRLGLPRRGEARRTNAPIPRSIHMNVTDGLDGTRATVELLPRRFRNSSRLAEVSVFSPLYPNVPLPIESVEL